MPVGGNAIADLTSVLDATTLPGVDPDGSGEGFARLQRWVGDRYQTFEWAGDTLVDDVTGWDWPESENKWLTFNSVAVAKLSFEKTDAVWLNLATSESAEIITAYGEVFKDPVLKTLAVGDNLLANPYPQEIDLQDLVNLTGVPGVDPDGSGEGFVRLQIWTGERYQTFEWAGDTLVDDVTGWDWPESENKWLTFNSVSVADGVKIGVNQGFWISLSSSGDYDNPTIQFTPPAGL